MCREFFCGYLTWSLLGPHWRPADCKMLVTSKAQGTRIAVQVDQGSPDAWRRRPFYDEIKHWSRTAAAAPRRPGAPATHVLVLLGRRVVVIFPDRDVDLGQVADDERIFIDERVTPRGVKFEALKLKTDDHRLSGAAVRLLD